MLMSQYWPHTKQNLRIDQHMMHYIVINLLKELGKIEKNLK